MTTLKEAGEETQGSWRVRTVRWVGAVFILIWLAAPYWPYVVDDALISAAYAHEWVDSGSLRWTTGEVVEGYSNFLMVAWMALLALLDLDLAKWAQLSSLAFAAATLGLLSARLPRGWGGTATLLAVSVLASLNYWSVQAMETSLYTLLLASAWSMTLVGGRAWPIAFSAAALASLTRPEGMAHLGIIAATGLLPENRNARSASWFAGIVGALGIYHALRYSHFGSLWPTSVLVKVSGVPLGLHGLAQLAGDSVPFLGVAVVAGVSLRFQRSPRLALAVMPFLVQGAVLIRASGDWMVWSRLSMPGFVASLAAASILVKSTSATPLRLFLSAVGLLIAFGVSSSGFGTLELKTRTPPSPKGSLSAYTQGLDTPVAGDVVWAAWTIAEGDSLMAIDAGILGNMIDMNFIDLRGLTHRPSAQAAAEMRVEDWFREQVTSDPPSIDWLRIAQWDRKDPPPVPEYLFGHFELAGTVPYAAGNTWWYASTSRRADVDLAVRRLVHLSQRYPSQPFLARHAAIALLAGGRSAEAHAVALASHRRWPNEPIFAAVPDSLTILGGTVPIRWHTDRGFAIYWNAHLWSIPMSSAKAKTAVIHLDQDKAGEEPAKARVLVSGSCAWDEAYAVHQPIQVSLEAMQCAANGDSTITVFFMNDEQVGDQDRNLYVRIEAPAY